MDQRYDVLGLGLMLAAVALIAWTGISGPLFNITGSIDANGLAAWIQAIASVAALIGIYIAAVIPVRAQARAKSYEDKIRADGIGLLILGDLLALRGEIERLLTNGSLRDKPVLPPKTLVDRADHLYLLGTAGGRLLQMIGLLTGVAAQTTAVHASITTGIIRGEEAIWENHTSIMNLALVNIDEAIADIQRR